MLLLIGPALGSSDFLTVYISNGQVVFAFDTGAGVISTQTSHTYTDNQWHTLSANRTTVGSHIVVSGRRFVPVVVLIPHSHPCRPC
jgi:hypothetical protein